MFRDFVSRRAEAKAEASRHEPVSGALRVVPEKAAVATQHRLNAVDATLRARLDLKSRLHEVLLGRLNLSVLDRVERSELKAEIGALVQDFLATENRPMRAEDAEKLTDELLDEVMGLGPLEPLLADPSVADVLVNSYRNVYVERDGLLERVPVQLSVVS